MPALTFPWFLGIITAPFATDTVISAILLKKATSACHLHDRLHFAQVQLSPHVSKVLNSHNNMLNNNHQHRESQTDRASNIRLMIRGPLGIMKGSGRKRPVCGTVYVSEGQ